ncbi:MAG: hypothetical protein GZ091_10620 [Paludibacter sp.]|nr:hypothetical protein [Paludibacter sp.]
MRINLAQLSTKDLATLSQRVITISEEPASLVVKDNPLLSVLKTVYADYDAVYTKKAYSGKGVLVAEADSRRDIPFGGLKNIILGYSKISGTPFQQKAKDIYAIVENYGIDLDRYTYSTETAQLKKLLEAFDKPENVAKLESMQLTAIVTQIKTAQTEFEQIFNEQAAANAELRVMESASSIRKNLELAMRNYLNVVKAMNLQLGWKELYAKLDEVLKAANNSKQVAKPETTVSTKI